MNRVGCDHVSCWRANEALLALIAEHRPQRYIFSARRFAETRHQLVLLRTGHTGTESVRQFVRETIVVNDGMRERALPNGRRPDNDHARYAGTAKRGDCAP